MSTPFSKAKYLLASPLLRVLDWVSGIGLLADKAYSRVFAWTQA